MRLVPVVNKQVVAATTIYLRTPHRSHEGRVTQEQTAIAFVFTPTGGSVLDSIR